MKELLRLHWRLERNHIKRRLSYLRIYFDWAGTITYLWLAAFFLFLIGWYLYDPFGWIPLPVRQNIVLAGQLLLLGVPGFWLLGGILRAAFTPVFLSMADAHYLPLTPLKKSTIVAEQWFWAVSRRMVPALLGPVLVYPLLRIFWSGYTLGTMGVMQGVWLVSAIIGLDIQWVLAVVFSWLRRNRIFAWIKGFVVLALFILVIAGLWRLPVGMSSRAMPQGPAVSGVAGTAGVVGVPGVTGGAGVPGVQGVTGVPGGEGLTGVSGTQGVSGVPGSEGVQGTPFMVSLPLLTPLGTEPASTGAVLFAVLLTVIVLGWYSRRSWAPIMQQTEQVHTLRTLMRSRDKRALQRYRRSSRRGRLLSKLLGSAYLPPGWALSWKSVLAWKSIPLLQWAALITPLLLIRLMLLGVGSIPATNPFEALLAPVLYREFPAVLFVLQGFVGLLTSWQEDLQQMEKFRLLPLYPRQIIVSTVVPAGALVGIGWAAALPLTVPLQGGEWILAVAMALVEGFLGALLVAREMLKDPSSYTSALGPERLVSAVVFLLGPVTVQGCLIGGQGLEVGLGAGIVVAAGAAFLWVIFMMNEYTLLRAKYGV